MSRCNGDETGMVLCGCRQYMHLEYITNSVKKCNFLDSDVVVLYFSGIVLDTLNLLQVFQEARLVVIFFFLFVSSVN